MSEHVRLRSAHVSEQSSTPNLIKMFGVNVKLISPNQMVRVVIKLKLYLFI